MIETKDDLAEAFKEKELLPIAEELGIGLVACSVAVDLPVVPENLTAEELHKTVMERHTYVWSALLKNGTLEDLRPTFEKMASQVMTLSDLTYIMSPKNSKSPTLH